MKLSLDTRWNLRNQYRILERLDPDARDECRRAIDVLENGYELDYTEVAQAFMEPMTEEKCREVRDILEMHRELRWSWDDLADKSGIDEHSVSFHGFDGNTEAKLLGYARFLIDDDHWSELVGSGDHLNSHMPVLDTYRRMLPVWRECVQNRPLRGSGHNLLSLEDIKRICAERVHPENSGDSLGPNPVASDNG